MTTPTVTISRVLFDRMIEAMKPFEKLFMDNRERWPAPVSFDAVIATKDARAIAYVAEDARAALNAEQGEEDNPYNVDRPNEIADYGHDNSVSPAHQTPYYCAKCGDNMGDTDLPKNVPERKYAVCYKCQQPALQSSQPEPSAKLTINFPDGPDVCGTCDGRGVGCPVCAGDDGTGPDVTELAGGELPPLPKHLIRDDTCHDTAYFDDRMMQDYARAAIAQSEHSHLQSIASTIGVGGYNGATTGQLVERIRGEFARLLGLLFAQSKQVPEAYALVPVEPTPEMLYALIKQWDSIGGRTMYQNYQAMLAAAPQAARPQASEPAHPLAKQVKEAQQRLAELPDGGASIQLQGPVDHIEQHLGMVVIDCRQCEFRGYMPSKPNEWICAHDEPCTNGDKFTKLEPVQLYRRGV